MRRSILAMVVVVLAGGVWAATKISDYKEVTTLRTNDYFLVAQPDLGTNAKIAVANMAFGSGVSGSLPATLLYASQNGCALDSNLGTGGGTDDTAALQALLDQATNGPVEIVLDGVSLVRTSIVVHSNTKLRGLPGCGLYLADASHCTMIGNAQAGFPHEYTCTNVLLQDLVLNGNGANQARWEANAGDRGTNWWNMGLWFAGFADLTLRNVQMREATTFAFMFNNGERLSLENCRAWWAAGGEGEAGHNWDGIHLMGPLTGVKVDGFESNGDDDVLAFNTDENVSRHEMRWGTNYGGMTNLVIENVHFAKSSNGVRFYTEETGYQYISDLLLRNIHGAVLRVAMNGVLPVESRVGTLTIDGWHVEGLPQMDFSPMVIDRVILRDIVTTNFGTLRALINLGANTKSALISGVYAQGDESLIYCDSATTDIAANNIIAKSCPDIFDGTARSLLLGNTFLLGDAEALTNAGASIGLVNLASSAIGGHELTPSPYNAMADSLGIPATNLVAWFIGDTLTNEYAPGASVSGWESDNGATVGLSLVPPVAQGPVLSTTNGLLNGHYFAYFNNTNAGVRVGLGTELGFIPTTRARTCYYVFNRYGNGSLLMQDSVNRDSYRIWLNSAHNDPYAELPYLGVYSDDLTGTSVVPTNQWEELAFYYDGVSGIGIDCHGTNSDSYSVSPLDTLRDNGTQIGFVNVPAIYSQWGDINVAEMLVYYASHDATQRSNVYSYLKTKYALP